MSSKRTTVLAAAGAIVIALIVVAGVLYFGLSKPTAKVELPDITAPIQLPDSSPVTSAELGDGLLRAEVTPETVRFAIAEIKRPDSYSRTLTVETHWEGGFAVRTVEAWVRSGETRLVVSGSGGVKNVLLRGEELYIWYDGEPGVYRGEAAALTESGLLSDEFQMLRSYESLLALDNAEIADAGYVELEGKYYIYVETAPGRLGYVDRYYVSIETGLLEYAETLAEGQRVIAMSATEAELAPPPDELFVLPE